jgi:hypothetical protein
MNLIEALKTGLAINIPKRCFHSRRVDPFMPTTHYPPGSWFEPDFLIECVYLEKRDFLSNNWHVKKCRSKTVREEK